MLPDAVGAPPSKSASLCRVSAPPLQRAHSGSAGHSAPAGPSRSAPRRRPLQDVDVTLSDDSGKAVCRAVASCDNNFCVQARGSHQRHSLGYA